MNVFCRLTGLIAVSVMCACGLSAAEKTPVVTLIPNPDSLVVSGGILKLDKKKLSVCAADSALRPAADYLVECLSAYGMSAVVGQDDGSAIRLKLVAPDSLLSVRGAYRMSITPQGVTVSAAGYNGITNGIATLRQLLPAPTASVVKSQKPVIVPCVEIADAPDYWWRGMHLDSSRHFWTISEVEQYLDLMALYKLSVFHWHLIDDQGWRVQISRYPELTEKGAWRHFNAMDSACESRASHEPSMRIPRDRMRPCENGDSLYGGFYTQQQLHHIVDYAARRGIEVVPEFDVPGHSTILTMVHPEVSCNGRPNSSVCPGKDTTLELCKNVFKEIFDIFPSRYIHMGGDEVDKTRWRSCPDCASRMVAHEMESADELQAWFVRQMELFFRNNNRTLIGWDEITYDGLGAETAIMWWTAPKPEVVAEATRSGKHVTCSPTSCLYFDYPQTDAEADKILALDPRAGLTPRQQKLINGLQGNVWSEYIPTAAKIQTQIFPRMIALAESAWNADPANRLSVDEFWSRICAHLERFDAMGVAYRIPDRFKQSKK